MTGIRRAPDTRAAPGYDGPEPPAPRQDVVFRCGKGHDRTVTFAAGITAPDTWECTCGAAAARSGAVLAPVSSNAVTEHERHRRLVRDRRSAAEAEEILGEALDRLRAAGGRAAS